MTFNDFVAKLREALVAGIVVGAVIGLILAVVR